MGKNASRRKAKAYEDIARLRANRRKDCIKCAAALAALALLVTAKLALETSGILETGSMAAGAVMMASGIGQKTARPSRSHADDAMPPGTMAPARPISSADFPRNVNGR